MKKAFLAAATIAVLVSLALYFGSKSAGTSSTVIELPGGVKISQEQWSKVSSCPVGTTVCIDARNGAKIKNIKANENVGCNGETVGVHSTGGASIEGLTASQNETRC